LTTGKDLA